MSRSTVTITSFGAYSLAVGALLMVAPNLMLASFGVPATSEVWIRVLGVAVANVGVYYIYAAKSNARAFFQASVFTRLFAMLAFGAFAALGLASPRLLLFGGAEVAGALWTFLALRQETRIAVSE